ncbi:peptidoglycan bridge formation glycyltransferase FemA/FemB family protein [Lachnospiraceae bacterium]|nr:peptidoglycan bridge formation glycyltransferase FemA/FemB family protein [Lachnospiraceae bacterium]
MIELIRYDEPDKWNDIVNTYEKGDIYYKCEYSVSFMKNEDGTPYLLSYEGNDCRLCYPIIEKDIADFAAFQNSLEHGKYFDWNTPYGYGGPLTEVEKLSVSQQEDFKKELYELAGERNVITQFVRFHPLLQNQKACDEVIEHVYIKDTIFIDLDTQEDLLIQMDTKNRNLVRKAIKNNIVIKHDDGKCIDEFMKIYGITMNRDNARDFYYFPRSYYEYIRENMTAQTEYFYAYKGETMVAASIFFYSGQNMHYHLSGNLLEYRTFAPTNLILYEAANWGREKGMKALHLGGGVGVEDSLFHFKKQFNKNGRIGFHIGRNIFSPDKYRELLYKRQQVTPEFDVNNSYYIQYRKPEL